MIPPFELYLQDSNMPTGGGSLIKRTGAVVVPFRVQKSWQLAMAMLSKTLREGIQNNRPYHGYRRMILTGGQSGQNLQCLYWNPMANSFVEN